MAELPLNWIECELEKVVKLSSGGTPKSSNKKYYEGGTIPWLIIADLNDGYIEKAKTNITELGLRESSAKIVPLGAILIAMYGSIGKLGIANISCATNQAIAFTEKIDLNLDNKFLYYYLFSIKSYLASLGKGGAQQNISQTVLKKIPILLPPLNEQKRIVEKLDKMIRIVDDVNSRLNKIPTALKRARQSILNQAITGELTKDWRKKNNIQITKDDLKNKIQTELNFLYRNKKITKENLQIKIDDIRENSCSSWFNIKARFLCHHITKGTTPKQILEIGAIPYLKVYNIVNNKIDFSYKPQFVSFETHNTFLERSKVYPNDVVMNIVGPPLGKVAIIPNDYKEWNINQALAIFRPIKYLLSEYVYIVLSCDSTLLPVLPDVKGIVGQSNISLEQCRNLLFPLPPIEEQTEIVRRVKLAFEKLDKIESRYQKAKEYSDKLTQSILNKAFRGELVPQDPNDSPIKIPE